MWPFVDYRFLAGTGHIRVLDIVLEIEFAFYDVLQPTCEFYLGILLLFLLWHLVLRLFLVILLH